MRTSPALVVALSLAALLSLSACSGAPTSGSGADPDESPLAKYLSSLYGGDLSQEEQQKKFAADEKDREEAVSACMKEEGFEYLPAVSNFSFDAGADEWKPDDRDWVSQYGYGMINFPGMDDTAPSDEYVDPNADYVASLSESEQQAYYEALNGPQPTEEELSDDGSYEYNWETAGCYGSAQHELEGDNPLDSEEHKPVLDAINALYTDMEKAPELADLNAAWSSCMSDAGYPGFTTQTDAQTSVSDEYNGLYDGETGEGPDESETAALAKKEVEIALADLDCREKTDYKQKRADVQADLEQQFIDDHKAELDALKADAEQGN